MLDHFGGTGNVGGCVEVLKRVLRVMIHGCVDWLYYRPINKLSLPVYQTNLINVRIIRLIQPFLWNNGFIDD